MAICFAEVTTDMAKNTCFVIMPFSATSSTTEKEWAYIYEKIIKPAVEDSGDFECKRSNATRGNIMKEIIVALNDSDLVVADLTDHNPNVCYELGVRHGLKIGTILLAQKRRFLEIFDLHNYASHVYDFRKKSGKQIMSEKIKELVDDFLSDPLKIDSPAQDFLQDRPSYVGAPSHEIKDVLEFDSERKPVIVLPKNKLSGKLVAGLVLLGNGASGVTLPELVEQVSKNWKRVKSSDLSPILKQQMNGWVIKEGKPKKYVYRLTRKGRNEILDVVKGF